MLQFCIIWSFGTRHNLISTFMGGELLRSRMPREKAEM
jgi:hypothetical protein